MMAMQGFSGTRLGLWTRRALRGGRRMGLCVPVMVVVLCVRLLFWKSWRCLLSRG